MELLAHVPRPTAIFACSDQQAIGALHAWALSGVPVPSEMSVCGFDAIALSGLVAPALTSVRQRVEEMARAAVGLLLGDPGRHPTTVTVRTELVIRDSCAAVTSMSTKESQ